VLQEDLPDGVLIRADMTEVRTRVTISVAGLPPDRDWEREFPVDTPVEDLISEVRAALEGMA
jgi:hypothetical protein